jgi:hypothetical protein
MASPQYTPVKEEEYLPHTTPNSPLSSKEPIWLRFSGKDRRKVGWKESAKAIFFVSCKPIIIIKSSVFVTTAYCHWDALYAGINSWLIFIPFAWVCHFKGWGHGTTFACMSC